MKGCPEEGESRSSPPLPLVDHYEALRRQVFGFPAPVPRGPGLALLMSRGMAAWMDTWWTCLDPPVATATAAQEGLPQARRAEMVMILVEMALAKGREEKG